MPLTIFLLLNHVLPFTQQLWMLPLFVGQVRFECQTHANRAIHVVKQQQWDLSGHGDTLVSSPVSHSVKK